MNIVKKLKIKNPAPTIADTGSGGTEVKNLMDKQIN